MTDKEQTESSFESEKIIEDFEKIQFNDHPGDIQNDEHSHSNKTQDDQGKSKGLDGNHQTSEGKFQDALSCLKEENQQLRKELESKVLFIQENSLSLKEKIQEIKDLKNSEIEVLARGESLTIEVRKLLEKNKEHESTIIRATSEKLQLQQELDILYRGLKQELKCPICLSVPKTEKIPVCKNGHITCSTCSQERCPVCSVFMKEFGGVQRYSIIAQNVSLFMKFDCVNKELGCNARKKKNRILCHEKIACLFTRNLDCPGFCNAKLSPREYNAHVDKCLKDHRSFKNISLGHSVKFTMHNHEKPRGGTYRFCRTVNLDDDKIKFLIIGKESEKSPWCFLVQHWDFQSIAEASSSMDLDSVKQAEFLVKLSVSDPTMKISRSASGRSVPVEQELTMDSAVESGSVLEISARVMEKMNSSSLGYHIELFVEKRL